MIYSNEFKALVDQTSSFIGYGNPNAKILILGKEAAIDTNENAIQHASEINKNVESWKKNIEQKVSQDDIPLWRGNPECMNPLYPYKGQKYKVDMKGHESGGTSRTWFQYQKLLNFILNREGNGNIDFHEHCFSSDFSAETALFSKDTDKEATKHSIEERKQMFASPFFQNFPIIIAACGHYPKVYNIDLENIFQVKWDGKTQKRFWIHIHREKENASPKLLIHTNQLSMVPDQLIIDITKVVKAFAETYSIHL